MINMDEEKRKKMAEILNNIGRMAFESLRNGEDFVILLTSEKTFLGLMNIKHDSPNFDRLIQGQQGQINDLISAYHNRKKPEEERSDVVIADIVKNEVDGTVSINFK
jgi:hypothetical protein